MTERIRIVESGNILTVCRVTFDPFDQPVNFEPLIIDASSLSSLRDLIADVVKSAEVSPLREEEIL